MQKTKRKKGHSSGKGRYAMDKILQELEENNQPRTLYINLIIYK